jgi:hypothetical protein
MPRDQTEAALRELLEERRGHLEVAEEGTLVYSFHPRLLRRDETPLWDRIRSRSWKLFKAGFKVWIVVMLVVYFVVFVALLIAALVAAKSRDEGGGGWGGGSRGGHGHHHHGLGDLLFWYWIWSPGWRGRPYYGHRFPHEGTGRGDREDKVPFYKKVFAFVFGPDEPRLTREQKDRGTLRLIRAREGVLTTAELMQHTGLLRPEAEEEMARLMTSYEGDVRVSDDGELAYVFPELMVSAHGRVEAREPDPAWRRLETPRSLTGNETSSNLLIGGINGFNMVAAATAPFFIFPRLGLGGTAAWVGLVWVPLVFSTLFFSVPLARWFSVARENARRAARNVRKVVMGFVYRSSLVGDGAQPVRAPELTRQVADILEEAREEPSRVETSLHELAAEFDAEVEPGSEGSLEYRFPEILAQYRAGQRLRRELALGETELGEIVYSSADDVARASERDRAAFDRELEEGRPSPEGLPEAGATGDEASEVEVAGLVEPPDRIRYVEDWEPLAAEKEVRRTVVRR